MIDSAQTGARCREKQEGERDSLKHSNGRNKRIPRLRCDGFGKAVRMGPIAHARAVNPQFSDANAGHRGYNRRHFPAGDAARMEGGTTPSCKSMSRTRGKNEQKRERLKGESICPRSVIIVFFPFFFCKFSCPIRLENRLFNNLENFLVSCDD